MINSPLCSFVTAATNPFALGVLIAGLLASVAIAVGPPVRDFYRRLPQHAAALRSNAFETMKDPRRARPAAAAIGQLPRAALMYGLLGIALGAWAGYAFTQSNMQTRTTERTQFEHVMSIGYVAHGAPSALLPDGTASPVSSDTVERTGSQPPLYSALLSKIDVAINYEMKSAEPLSVLGYGGAALRIKAQDGWERTLSPLPAQFLSGPNVTLWSTVDLDAVRLVIAGVEFATGSKSDWYDITLVPVVRLAGQRGEAHIDETYAPEFRWRYDSVHITPDARLTRSEKKIERTTVRVPTRAGAFGLSLKLSTARWVALMGAVVALAGAVALIMMRARDGSGLAPAPPDSDARKASSTTSAKAVAGQPGSAAVPPAPASDATSNVGAGAVAANGARSGPPPSVAAAVSLPGAVADLDPPSEQVLRSVANAETAALLAASVAPAANGALAPEPRRPDAIHPQFSEDAPAA